MTTFFKDYDELEDWLETITTLEQFWKETAIFNVPVPASEDGMREMIINGDIKAETALSALKGTFRTMLGHQLKLGYNTEAPINVSVH